MLRIRPIRVLATNWPSGIDECEAICDEVANYDGQAKGTLTAGELTGTSCDAG